MQWKWSTQKVKFKFDYALQKLIGTDQDQTSSIKALYNKGIHTIVITRALYRQMLASIEEGSAIMLGMAKAMVLI